MSQPCRGLTNQRGTPVAKRNTRRNASEQLLRTAAWAVVVLAFFLATHPATARADAQLGGALAVALAVGLIATRNK